jgi:serine phosphatase RsbU (regulator of sigma subunit)
VDASAEYPTETFDLAHTNGIVLYTDGVPDAMAPNEARFGMEGLQKSLQHDFKSVQSISDRIIAAIDAFRGSRSLVDDLALVTIQMQSQHAIAAENASSK